VYKLITGVLVTAVLGLCGPASAATSSCQQAVDHPDWCTSARTMGHRTEEGSNENTLLALRHVASYGNAWFETDQWNLASDSGVPNAGQPVIFHDPTLGRVVSDACLKKAGLTKDTHINTVTMAQFKLLCTKGGEPLPTLKQYIDLAGQLQVHGIIEVKYVPNSPSTVASWVNQANAPVSFYAAPQYQNGKCYQTAMTKMKQVGMTVGLKNRSQYCPMSLAQIASFGYAFETTTTAVATASYVQNAHDLGIKVGVPASTDNSFRATLVDRHIDYLLSNDPKNLECWLHAKAC
jgi:glycerophosphoryl diester phosphodiesterase